MRPSDLTNLAGRVALITGGSSEIGEAISTLLSRAGATVIVQYYKNQDKGKEICDRINSAGASAIAFEADLSDEASTGSLFSFISQRLGGLDILVNNVHAPIKRNYFLKTSWKEHEEQIEIMLKGAFFCSKMAIPLMEKKGGGSIINILTGLIDRPVEGYSSYITASSSLTGFTKNLAVEIGKKGIRVNMIAPGFVLTGQTPHAPEGVRNAILKATPLGRLATPEDIARAVLFFSSDLSRFITGVYIVVDGGFHLQGKPARINS